jgi:cephalosporin hydroxylase
MSFTPEEILSQLEKTEDGEYITPQTELWQIDPESMVEDGNAWRVDNVYSYQRLVDYPVFSSEAAAKRSIRSAERSIRSAEQRIKDLESHIVGLQGKAESDAKLIKQQVDQIKALLDALHEQRNVGEKDSAEIARKCVLIESLKKELHEARRI